MAATHAKGRAMTPGSRKAIRGRRRSITTWQSRPRAELLRFVIGADGVVRPDLTGRATGRGLWLDCRRSALDLARTKNIFSRLGRCAATVPADLADRVDAAIEQQMVETVGLAVRAGQVAYAPMTGGTGVLVTGAGQGQASWTGAVVTLESASKGARGFGRTAAEPLWIEDGVFARRLLCLAGRLKDWRNDAPTSAKGS